MTTQSGLPGPRGNIELARAVGEEADARTLDALVSTGDEYLVFCGVVGLGRLLGEGAGDDVERLLHGHARDSRWRVREAVAMALQRLGDADPARLLRLCSTWAADADPLVQRAAVAGICEPRLLRAPDTAAAALDTCARVTTSLAALPREDRRRPDVRVLRQALGYCWSVAVAADPERGLPAFLALSGSTDPDVVWIVRQNRAKARLARLL
nr:HEAT repeat domain-containing protein [Cellulomonas sp. APG4]